MMTIARSIAMMTLVLALPGTSFASESIGNMQLFAATHDEGQHHHFGHHGHHAAPAPAAAASPGPATEEEAAAHAHNAAKVAKHTAHLANKVAEHAIDITGHAQKSLHHALGALHDARVDTSGLSEDQKESLKKAEGRLREATKKAEYGDLRKEKMEKDLEKSKNEKSEKEQMLEEIQELRKKLEGKVDDNGVGKDLDIFEAALEKSDDVSDDDKATLERLREQVDGLADEKAEAPKAVKNAAAMREDEGAVTPVLEKGIDIDTQMPFGELEPFGREDTAQELTESSVRESDEMVDQLERAEVAEEKRAVFRALTRLRGAAITSYDGVARSQTGNIDEYNKVHKWRKVHPMHHLADEESDITKWAFPENADFFLQRKL